MARRLRARPRTPKRATRLSCAGCAFRLTLSYVLFFTVLLVAIGLLFREDVAARRWTATSRAAARRRMGRGQRLSAHRKRQRPVWIADSTDPEEAYIVERLRHVYLLTDPNGICAGTFARPTIRSASIRREEIARILQPAASRRSTYAGIPTASPT